MRVLLFFLGMARAVPAAAQLEPQVPFERMDAGRNGAISRIEAAGLRGLLERNSESRNSSTVRAPMALLVLSFALFLAVAGCAMHAGSGARTDQSLLPGTIGLVVAREPAGVMVRALGSHGPAARAGLRVGDIIVSYDGAPVTDERQLNRLVAESKPGSVVRVEFVRDGETRVLDVPVRQLDITPRG